MGFVEVAGSRIHKESFTSMRGVVFFLVEYIGTKRVRLKGEERKRKLSLDR